MLLFSWNLPYTQQKSPKRLTLMVYNRVSISTSISTTDKAALKVWTFKQEWMWRVSVYHTQTKKNRKGEEYQGRIGLTSGSVQAFQPLPHTKATIRQQWQASDSKQIKWSAHKRFIASRHKSLPSKDNLRLFHPRKLHFLSLWRSQRKHLLALFSVTPKWFVWAEMRHKNHNQSWTVSRTQKVRLGAIPIWSFYCHPWESECGW